ncbi:MAG: hypothetical protein ACUVWX_07015 [Kiritimatiellia bacterium]
MRGGMLVLVTAALKVAAALTSLVASDWPQFMRDCSHTGDAADEELVLPLELELDVKLGDAILSSPVVIGNRVYVLDQMGTAYAIDTETGRVL